MDSDTAKTPFERIIELLHTEGVEFIVIGGQAEALYGSARVTYDTDLCHRRTAKNFERLAEALAKISPSLRGAPADLPFRLDAESLAAGVNFTLRTTVGDLDLIGRAEPIGGYEELLEQAETIGIGGVEFKVAGLDDLIRIKEHINRPKDRDSLMHLRAIKKLREQGK